MCLLSMKASSSSPSDYDSNKILITDTSRLTTNHFMPMPLSTPHDSAFLSPLQCYIRENCIEFFAVDSDESVYVRKGRQTELCNGRVGVRCVYCKHTTKRANQSAGFPKRIEKIYSAASMIQCRHFPNCAHIPKPVKYMLARLKKQGNAAVNMLEVSEVRVATNNRELIFMYIPNNLIHDLCFDTSIGLTVLVSWGLLILTKIFGSNKGIPNQTRPVSLSATAATNCLLQVSILSSPSHLHAHELLLPLTFLLETTLKPLSHHS